ncbi:hypothetical protein [Paraburkholderia sp. J12]|uniref:hypothetical protein n=1 Tax=Paraburkholderia sp. J12 TaxID=2805432 RepID=UPI002ABD84DE|nr:hypothetical protein [Paraburkholderia sp. J12]
MLRIKNRLSAILVVATLALSACAVNNSPEETGASTVPLTPDPAASDRYLVSETPTAIMDKGFYLRVHQENDHWIADFVSRSPVGRRSKDDEVFFVSEDRRHWWLTVHRNMGYCGPGAFAYNAEYTVCNSTFGRFSAFGEAMTFFGSGPVETGKPMAINHAQVVGAIWSIPESNLAGVYAALLAQDRADQQGHAAAVVAEQVISERIRQREAAQVHADLMRMSREPRGSEDACEIQRSTGNVWCRANNTNVPIGSLPNYGWVVVQPILDGNLEVSGYLIRKVK